MKEPFESPSEVINSTAETKDSPANPPATAFTISVEVKKPQQKLAASKKILESRPKTRSVVTRSLQTRIAVPRGLLKVKPCLNETFEFVRPVTAATFSAKPSLAQKRLLERFATRPKLRPKVKVQELPKKPPFMGITFKEYVKRQEQRVKKVRTLSMTQNKENGLGEIIHRIPKKLNLLLAGDKDGYGVRSLTTTTTHSKLKKLILPHVKNMHVMNKAFDTRKGVEKSLY